MARMAEWGEDVFLELVRKTRLAPTGTGIRTLFPEISVVYKPNSISELMA